jgi:hypothetical protein
MRYKDNLCAMSRFKKGEMSMTKVKKFQLTDGISILGMYVYKEVLHLMETSCGS